MNSTPDEKYILGISAFYHDSAAALIRDGEIIAATHEERFSRIKHDMSFPLSSINYCLEEARITIKELDAIVFYDNPMITLERIITSHISVSPLGSDLWSSMVPKWVTTKLCIPEIISEELGYGGNFFFTQHHVSHAASAFFPSSFEESAILTIDGVGEWSTSSIGYGKGNNIELLETLSFPDSVGLLYSAFTYYVGFRVNSGEYKLMGLAPYGEPKFVDKIKSELVHINPDGSIRLNMDYFDYLSGMKMTNDKFNELFGGLPRDPESQITQREMDLAKSIQTVTEEIIMKMANHAYNLTRCENLCLAGGVALNCVANGKLLREGKFKQIWIQPAAGDAGGALGSALYFYYSRYNRDRDSSKSIQRGSYWGPQYSNYEVESVLESYGIKYEKKSGSERSKYIARALSQGKVVGHFSGRMEYGPRALGSRSILGDPRDSNTQSKINLKIKYRESFRPFAPTVLEEDISEYFEMDCASPYMLLVSQVKEDRILKVPFETDIIERVNQKRSDIPAVTHVDYSARIQSISKDDHPIYYDIISEFKKITDYGVIVNTSFNVRGEPIVCTPYQAVACFMNTEMDILAIEDFIILKSEQAKDLFLVFRQQRYNRQPHHNGRDKSTESKISSKSQKLFQKHILAFGQKTDITLYPNSGKESQDTFWSKYDTNQGFVEYDLSREISVLEESEKILSHWNRTYSKDKKTVLPLLVDLIKLKRKYRHLYYFQSEIVSDSLYAMF